MQRIQHRFLARCLDFLPCQRFSGARVDRIQRDHILAAQVGNRAVQHGFDAHALADFASYLSGDALIGRTPHELQRLPYLLLWEDIQIGGLLKVNGQRLS